VPAGDLRQRSIDSTRVEVEAFGGAAMDSFVLHRDRLVAAVNPATPRRSFLNSVFYADSAALARQIEDVETDYRANGVTAWAVWVPDRDRQSASLLARRGHSLDAAHRAMAIVLADLHSAPPAPSGIEAGPGNALTAMGLNDRAYGQQTGWFYSATHCPVPIRWHVAYQDGEAIGCVGTIPSGDDCCVTGIATLPEHRGRGIASWLLHEALVGAHRDGTVTASLRATAAGAPLYKHLGFVDCGYLEMWELRHPVA
jgi:GNAT superfamily N-acetyltransferase